MTNYLITQELLYCASGIALFGIGLFRIVVAPHILRKILAVNVAGMGVFMLMVASASNADSAPDPVPHAMVLTGIVVAIAGTALALSLVCRIHALGSSDERVPGEGQ